MKQLEKQLKSGVMTPGVSVNAYQLNVDEMSAAVMEAHKVGRKVCT